jgi:hypothetical protein
MSIDEALEALPEGKSCNELPAQSISNYKKSSAKGVLNKALEIVEKYKHVKENYPQTVFQTELKKEPSIGNYKLEDFKDDKLTFYFNYRVEWDVKNYDKLSKIAKEHNLEIKDTGLGEMTILNNKISSRIGSGYIVFDVNHEKAEDLLERIGSDLFNAKAVIEEELED